MFSKVFSGISKQQLRTLVIVGFFGALMLAGPSGQSSAQLILRTPQGDRVFAGEVSDGMTILDALNASVVAGNIPLQFSIDEQKDVTIIRRLDGHASSTVLFYLNDRLIESTKIHETPIQSNDVIVVKLPS